MARCIQAQAHNIYELKGFYIWTFYYFNFIWSQWDYVSAHMDAIRIADNNVIWCFDIYDSFVVRMLNVETFNIATIRAS